jgi:hypothetical protein
MIRKLINAGGDEVAIAAHAFRSATTLAAAAGRWSSTASPAPGEAIRVSATRRSMPDFAYVGLDTAGRERRGSVRAETPTWPGRS